MTSNPKRSLWTGLAHFIAAVVIGALAFGAGWLGLGHWTQRHVSPAAPEWDQVDAERVKEALDGLQHHHQEAP